MHSATPPINESPLFLTTSKDGGVLLDVKHDRILKLNNSGVLMWTLLSQGFSEEEIGQRLAQEYHVDEARIREDVHSLLEAAGELSLDPYLTVVVSVEQSDGAEGPQKECASFPWYGQNDNDKRPKPGPLLIMKALLGLGWFDAILTFRSFEVLCMGVKQWHVAPQRRETGMIRIGEVCSAVERACVWYPKKALCLQRSAVTACLLRGLGVDARMVVGVRPVPFLAHAWVEAQGAVVNDWPRVKKFYSMVAAY